MARLKQYILNVEHEPCEATMLEWGAWFQDMEHRRVALDEIGDYDVSTIFLGIDHNWSASGPPILFETMIFKRAEAPDKLGMNHLQRRWATWQDALDGHRLVCDALTERLGIGRLSAIDTAPRGERGYLH